MELERRSVLIVEDEEQVRLLLAVMLERQGYEVTTVVSGLEAVDELRSRQFDVVVADCQSPHLDGMRLMLLVRIMWPHMPVILLSGELGRSQRWATELGAFACFAKPFPSDEFLRSVEQATAHSYVI
ncbi:MAG: response regulator [Nitrospiraceae bacterium]|nr:response regulator [Nitrospiraceae bacterium]